MRVKRITTIDHQLGGGCDGNLGLNIRDVGWGSDINGVRGRRDLGRRVRVTRMESDSSSIGGCGGQNLTRGCGWDFVFGLGNSRSRILNTDGRLLVLLVLLDTFPPDNDLAVSLGSISLGRHVSSSAQRTGVHRNTQNSFLFFVNQPTPPTPTHISLYTHLRLFKRLS